MTEIILDQYPSRCTERQSIIVSKDDGHDWKHIGHNKNSRVRHFKIDGEVLPRGKGPERCDFLLLNDTAKTAYFIELKGSPSYLSKCIAQVENTEAMCKRSLADYPHFYYRFVLGSGSGTYGSAFVKWRDKKPRKSVEVKRGILEEEIG